VQRLTVVGAVTRDAGSVTAFAAHEHPARLPECGRVRACAACSSCF
jgi:hypothetical protein